MDLRVFNAGFETIYKNVGGSAVKATGFLAKNLFLSIFLLLVVGVSAAQAQEKRVVVLGDSLTAGYGLEGGVAFPEELQKSLIADGIDAKVENAGVSGDTSAGGLARLEWSIAGDKAPDLVIVALGGNDMLRGLDVAMTRKNLSGILSGLKEKKIPALLVGMKAQSQYTETFQMQFDQIYPDLAKEYGVTLYPFFLEGVALDPALNLPDGIHPNEKGLAEMVRRMSPVVKNLL